MTLLPIVRRELSVRARLPGTYRLRLLSAVGSALVVLGMIYIQRRAATPGSGALWAFYTLTVLAMVFSLLEGARSTADCISEERREGTLALLFLTDLRAHDVVLGKLVANSLNALYGLLAILPMMALPLLLGGVTLGEFARLVLVLLNTLFLSLCVGLWVSTRQDVHYRAVVSTLLVLAGILALPILIDALVLRVRAVPSAAMVSIASPALGFAFALDAYHAGASGAYWASLLTTQALAWGLLIATRWGLDRRWRDSPAFEGERWRGRGRGGVSNRRVGDLDPVRWLVLRQARSVWWIWPLALASVGATVWETLARTALPFRANPVAGAVHVSYFMAVHLCLVISACRCFAEARATGAMELVLTTPVGIDEILLGHRRALWRLLRPVVVAHLFVALAGSAGEWWLLTQRTGHGVVVSAIYPVFPALAKIGTLLVDIYAVGWVGMWFGLKSNRPGQAVFKTFAFFFLFPQLLFEVVPWALFSPLSFGFAWLIQPLLMIGKDLAFVAWARTRLETRFRAAAAERYTPDAMPWWEFRSVLRHWTQTKWTGLEGEVEPGN